MGRPELEAPLTEEERAFAAEHHYLVMKYLGIRKLAFDEWYDVVVFRYLRSVKRWHALPGLHRYSFESAAFLAMRSAVGNELEKQKRRVRTISLDEEVPGTDGMKYADTVTYRNLEYINYEGDGMEIRYDVELPERKAFRGGRKSDETLAIETFLKMKNKKNMCFEYESDAEAKKRLACIQSYRRKAGQREAYDAYRSGSCVYIVRLEILNPKKGRVV